MACNLLSTKPYIETNTAVSWIKPNTIIFGDNAAVDIFNKNDLELVVCNQAAIVMWINPYRAEFILGNIKIYLHFLLFIDAEMAYEVETWSWETMNRLSSITNNMFADDPSAIYGATASAGIVWV